MLLNGTGGIGKTTLAIEYLNKYQNFYDHLGFVEYNNDIKNSFLSAFVNTYKLDSQTLDERFEELLYNLQNLDGKNLLIIDDIKTSDDFEMIRNLSVNFELLITSRTEFNTVNKLDIEHLPKEKAKELFLDYFNTEENIDVLLEYLDYHTLFIKLTAQTLANSRTLTIKKIEEKFKNGEFGDIKNNLEQSTFNIYLEKLFNLSNLSKNEVLILKKLSLFPSIEIDFEKLKDFLCIEDEEEFDLNLTILSKNGWLIQNKNFFKLHQIIKEFLLSFHHILYKECDEIVKYFEKKLLLNPGDNPINIFELLPFSISLVFNLRDENKASIIFLYSNISSLYKEMGKLREAFFYQIKNLRDTKIFFGKKTLEVATSYHNISEIYREKGSLTKALIYQLKSIKITEDILGENHFDLASNYNTLSLIYQSQRELKLALSYQEKSLKLLEKDEKENHFFLAQIYNNISNIYLDIKKYEKALEYQKKSLIIKEHNYDNKHPSLAKSYNNISNIYFQMDNYKKALEYQRMSILIKEEVLGKEHPSLAISYENIALYYFRDTNIIEAKKAIDKAENIYKKLFPSGYYILDEISKIKEMIYQSK
ncbi:tetratricopeptide repeat protein [Aliarcobacter butzleri]|nr:tetratricopeptide repeat protein [Aliarcobacter butzleri]MCG3696452.1 tetratricopeptide repeat protein [Aliarcobacter butzleri]MCG3698594.1 tetratricopeptide repeat protein [Aliarcobacter butzleri]